jgi:MFS family permease
VTHTLGYAPGLAIGSLYFLGFTGIWLVLALFFQDGLAYSPLRSGLAVTPFALGVAASAVVAGRLVTRVGRWLTVSGLTITVVGLAATALVLREVEGDWAAWAVVAPLLLAGLGGGLVTSPNVTLTLEAGPVRMAGAAGGALQTATRIGGRYRPIGLGLLPNPHQQRPGLPQGGVRCRVVRVWADAGGPAAGHRRALAAALPTPRPAHGHRTA